LLPWNPSIPSVHLHEGAERSKVRTAWGFAPSRGSQAHPVPRAPCTKSGLHYRNRPASPARPKKKRAAPARHPVMATFCDATPGRGRRNAARRPLCRPQHTKKPKQAPLDPETPSAASSSSSSCPNRVFLLYYFARRKSQSQRRSGHHTHTTPPPHTHTHTHTPPHTHTPTHTHTHTQTPTQNKHTHNPR
jgi:hypothetical protein